MGKTSKRRCITPEGGRQKAATWMEQMLQQGKPKESAPATSHRPRLTSLRPECAEKILLAVHSWLSILSHVASGENIPGQTPDREIKKSRQSDCRVILCKQIWDLCSHSNADCALWKCHSKHYFKFKKKSIKKGTREVMPQKNRRPSFRCLSPDPPSRGEFKHRTENQRMFSAGWVIMRQMKLFGRAPTNDSKLRHSYVCEFLRKQIN